jgi:hypothetical protein
MGSRRSKCVLLDYCTLQVTTRAEDHGLDRPISPNPYMMAYISFATFFFTPLRRVRRVSSSEVSFYYVPRPHFLTATLPFRPIYLPNKHSRTKKTLPVRALRWINQQGRTRTSMRRLPSGHRLFHHDQRGVAAEIAHRRDEDQDRAALDITEIEYVMRRCVFFSTALIFFLPNGDDRLHFDGDGSRRG